MKKKKKNRSKFKRSHLVVLLLLLAATLLIIFFVHNIKSIYINNAYKIDPNIAHIVEEKNYSDLNSANVLAVINKERADNKIPTLEASSDLNIASKKAYEDMDARHYRSNVDPNGKKIYLDFIRNTGYQPAYADELISVELDNSYNVVNSWLLFPDTKDEILSTKYDQAGVYVDNNSKDTVLILASIKFLTLDQFNRGVNPISAKSIQTCIDAASQSVQMWSNYPNQSNPEYIQMIGLFNKRYDDCSTILADTLKNGYVGIQDVTLWNNVDNIAAKSIQMSDDLNKKN